MQIDINNDKAVITDKTIINSGAINYYKVDCNFSNEWNNLDKYAVFVQNKIAQNVPVVNNQAIIPKLDFTGNFYIGFVGYILDDNNNKIKQISTNLIRNIMRDGAGSYDTEEQDVISATVWEQYIAQINDLLSNIPLERRWE